jgi:formyl-CoA transferase
MPARGLTRPRTAFVISFFFFSTCCHGESSVNCSSGLYISVYQGTGGKGSADTAAGTANRREEENSMSDQLDGKEEFYSNAKDNFPGPLAGVRVLEITTTWAGPRVGSNLADYGADVVRVELAASPDIARFLPPLIPGTDPPDGHLNVEVNKNKRSISLDIRKPEGIAVFEKLLANTDIVIENFKKGTLAAYGIGYEDCRKIKPDIIYVSVTGFGQFGPYSNRPGYDPAAQAYSGFMWMNAASEEDEPMRAPIYLADELAGLHGAMGAMAALIYRSQSGEGQHVDISLLDSMMCSSTALVTVAGAGLPMPRMGNPLIFAAPTGIYKCKDGYVFAGVLLDAHWKIMARMTGHPELADDERYATFQERLKRRGEVDALLENWCTDRTRDEVVQACEEAEIAVARVNTPQEAVADAHVQARDALESVKTHSGNEIRITAPAAKFSRTPVHVRTCAPKLGQHTEEVLAEAGIGEEERKNLREQGIIM